MPRYELENQVAIVTGAGRGMGRAIALRLSREGAAVTVADLKEDSAAKVAGEIEADGGKALALRADVSRKADGDRMVAQTVERFGRLDILVNAAGVAVVQPVLEIDEATWDLQMNVNAKGVLLCSQAAARQMIEQGEGGRIINISSSAGKIPSGKDTPLTAYCASKHALEAITQQMGLEMARHKILVSSVFPGIVDTDMLTSIHRELARLRDIPVERLRADTEAAIPLGHLQQPESVAAMVAFLVSADASYTTGHYFDVTGGAFPYY